MEEINEEICLTRREGALKNTMEYKGYIGSVDLSEDEGVFCGKVLGIRALISYEGTSEKELVEDFHGAVDAYLELCREFGKEPEKTYKGTFKTCQKSSRS